VHWHTDDVNGPRSRVDASNYLTDRSHGQADELRALADASNTSNNTKMAGISNSEGARTYLGTRDAKHTVDGTNGLGS